MKQDEYNTQSRKVIWIILSVAMAFIWWHGFKNLPSSSAEKYHLAHQEAKQIVLDTLKQFDLKAPLLKFGTYPLLGEEFDEKSTFPLLSTPCPVTQGCSVLISALKRSLILKGYRILDSIESVSKDRPIHYAIAKLDQPVMAIRVIPNTSHATLILRIDQNTQVDIQSMLTINPHLCFVINEHSNIGRKVYDHLSLAGRELFLDLSTTYNTSKEDTSDVSSIINPLFKEITHVLAARPYFKGVWLDKDQLSNMSKESLSQFMQFLNQHRLILLTSAMNQHSLLNSLAQVYEVRSLIISDVFHQQDLNKVLSVIEGTLMMEGTASAYIHLTHYQQVKVLEQWLQKVGQSDTKLFRVSEISL
jgi:polysaccharide deacetylase 2 family uncharacterized protein YibQ